MANYFNITLDTTAPGGVGVKINGDEERAVSTQVTLNISCADADKTGYKMKIWGDIVNSSGYTIAEKDAVWEDYSATKDVTLNEFDDESNQRTVYVKVRDDLHNESAAASDSIILYTELPEINITTGPVPAKITTAAGKSGDIAAMIALSRSLVYFTVNKDVSDIKVMLVSNINAVHDDASNILIPSSTSTIGIIDTNADAGNMTISGTDGMTVSNQNIAAGKEIALSISGDDLKSVSPDDGVKLVKIFVKEKDANWSV